MADESEEDVREVKRIHAHLRLNTFCDQKYLTDSLLLLQRLKAALWFAVGKMVDEESLRRNRNATPQFIGALTEMVWAQIGEFFLFFSYQCLFFFLSYAFHLFIGEKHGVVVHH
jgi:CENP-S protein